MTEIRYEIRAVVPEYRDQLHVLAKFLDSVNLPDDTDEIALIAAASEKAFSGDAIDPPHRQYVFAIFDLEADRAVGTSMILGQLGRRDAP
ncbi:MAG: arginine N-succinyltransferase, partial [Deltaproteobacteria bacterium]|nr:arginine N-succinyltransferase [Deltaproteobacteria bacterium]